MITEITQVLLHRLKLKWKPGKTRDGTHLGPNRLVAVSVRKEGVIGKVYIETSKGPKALEWVHRLEVLGCLVTADNSDKEALEYRQNKAEKLY